MIAIQDLLHQRKWEGLVNFAMGERDVSLFQDLNSFKDLQIAGQIMLKLGWHGDAMEMKIEWLWIITFNNNQINLNNEVLFCSVLCTLCAFEIFNFFTRGAFMLMWHEVSCLVTMTVFGCLPVLRASVNKKHNYQHFYAWFDFYISFHFIIINKYFWGKLREFYFPEDSQELIWPEKHLEPSKEWFAGQIGWRDQR